MNLMFRPIGQGSAGVKRSRPLARLAPIAALAGSAAGTRVLAGAGWSIAGNGCARALTIVSALAAARVLGRDGFGAFSLVQLTIATAATLVALQMGSTATRFVAEYRHRSVTRTVAVIRLVTAAMVVLGAGASVGLHVAAKWISATVLRQPALVELVRIAAPGVFLVLCSGVQAGILSGLEEFRAAALVNLAGSAAIVVGVLGGSLSSGLQGAILGWVVGNGVLCAAGGYAVLRVQAGLGRPPRSALFSERAILFSYSLPVFLASMMLAAVFFRCNTLLAESHSLSEVALYAAADRFHFMLLFIPSALFSAMFPILSNLSGNGDRVACKQVLRTSFLLALVVLVIPALLVGIFSRLLLCVTFGHSFSIAAPVLSVLCLASVFEALNIALGYVLIVAGRVWLRCAIDMGLAVLLLGLGSSWIPRFGGLGLAGAYAVSFASASATLAAGLATMRRTMPAERTAQSNQWFVPACSISGRAPALTRSVSADESRG